MDWKKFGTATAASLLTITSLVNAAGADRSNSGHCEKPVCPTEPSCKRCPVGCVTPDVRPYIDDSRMIASGEVLFWQGVQDGLEYATANQVANNLVSANVLTGGQTGANVTPTTAGFGFASSQFYNVDKVSPDRNWDVGFRLGLGYTFVHDGWDLYVTWTHFHNNSSTQNNANTEIGNVTYFTDWSAIVPGGLGLVPAAGATSLIAVDPSATTIEANWKLRLDLVDVELGRDFYTSKYLTMRPFVGLRGVKLDQTFDVDYAGGTFTGITGSTLTPSGTLLDDVDMQNKFAGVGIRFGFNTDWTFCEGWSVYGNAAFSLIYGRFNVTQQEFLGDDDQANSFVILDVDNSFRSTKAMTDLALGLRYDWNCSCYHFAVFAGFEQHIAFNQNQLVHYTSTPSTLTTATTALPLTVPAPLLPLSYTTATPASGDLSTQGWTIGIEVDF